MCTVISVTSGGHLVGRTLDLDRSYGEQVVKVPAGKHFRLRAMGEADTRYAILGMGLMAGDYPLLYDGFNEKGLCMAGLNFPHSAWYAPEGEGPAPYELIPWLLGTCATVAEARQALAGRVLRSIPFSPQIPTAPMHWMICDREIAIVLEQTRQGLAIYDNPAGVMTNEPPLPYHLQNLARYQGLSVSNPQGAEVHYQGLGSVSLPGGLDSPGRFVRAAFTAQNALWEGTAAERVEQMLHVMGSVEMVKGLCRIPSGELDYSVYTAVMDPESGRYYYRTYYDRTLRWAQLDG